MSYLPKNLNTQYNAKNENILFQRVKIHNFSLNLEQLYVKFVTSDQKVMSNLQRNI